jgi:hypothetical protein
MNIFSAAKSKIIEKWIVTEMRLIQYSSKRKNWKCQKNNEFRQDLLSWGEIL